MDSRAVGERGDGPQGIPMAACDTAAPASPAPLDPESALGRFLVAQVEALHGAPIAAPQIVAQPLDEGASVVHYRERTSGVQVVGKFYGRKWFPARGGAEAEGMRRWLMGREAGNLACLRAAGFDQPPHEVVRPLACAPDLAALLLLAHAPGLPLTQIIHRGLSGEWERLLDAVGRCATFLAALHARTAHGEPADPAEALAYLAKIVEQLAVAGTADGPAETLAAMGERWRARGWLEGELTMVHGDATPANLILSATAVTAIDGERIRPADAAFDVGCLVAELKHLSFLWTGDPWAGEPLIARFYRDYSQARALSLAEITARGRAFMALYLLRIARNPWLSPAYRRRLVEEALTVGA